MDANDQQSHISNKTYTNIFHTLFGIYIYIIITLDNKGGPFYACYMHKKKPSVVTLILAIILAVSCNDQDSISNKSLQLLRDVTKSRAPHSANNYVFLHFKQEDPNVNRIINQILQRSKEKMPMSIIELNNQDLLAKHIGEHPLNKSIFDILYHKEELLNIYHINDFSPDISPLKTYLNITKHFTGVETPAGFFAGVDLSSYNLSFLSGGVTDDDVFIVILNTLLLDCDDRPLIALLQKNAPVLVLYNTSYLQRSDVESYKNNFDLDFEYRALNSSQKSKLEPLYNELLTEKLNIVLRASGKGELTQQSLYWGDCEHFLLHFEVVP